MKKRLMMAMMAGMLALSYAPAVHATEAGDMVEEQEEEGTEEEEGNLLFPEENTLAFDSGRAVEYDEDGVVTGIYYEEESIFDAEGTEGQEREEGDGIDNAVIDVSTLPSSDVNNSQLTLNASLPAGFDANIYAMIQNEKSGNIYQYSLYAVNTYTQRGHIPGGNYRVIEVGVYDDVNALFLFNPVEDFTLKRGDVKTVTVSLSNEEEVIALIRERGGAGEEEGSSDLTKYTESDFIVRHSGSGTGQMAVVGEQTVGFTLLVRISRGGVPGDMAVDISIDDGMTIAAEAVEVPLSGTLNIEGSGVMLYFDVAKSVINGETVYGEFIAGDTYRSVIHDPAKQIVYKEEIKGNVHMEIVDEDPEACVYDKFFEYGISTVMLAIYREGRPGEAIMSYSLDGTNFSEQMYVPEDGIYHIEGTTLSIVFTSESSTAAFVYGDTFTATPAEVAGEDNSLYIAAVILVLLFGGAAFAVIMYFKMQMAGSGSYTIQEYTPVKKLPEKQRKQARKKGGKR